MPTTTNFGWTTPADTDLVKDGAAAIRTLGNGIDTSLLDLKGGTTGQVLSKASNTDLDFSWVAQDDSNAIQNALLTTTGDTIYASAASTPARLGIGSTGQVLTVAGGVPTWAEPAGGGTVVKIVYAAYTTATTIASTTYADTGLTATITPTAATSKILILVNQYGWIYRESSAEAGASIKLLRSTTDIYDPGIKYTNYQGDGASPSNMSQGQMMTLMYLDSPNTTSATTYKTQGAAYESSNNGQVQFQKASARSTMILIEIGA